MYILKIKNKNENRPWKNELLQNYFGRWGRFTEATEFINLRFVSIQREEANFRGIVPTPPTLARWQQQASVSTQDCSKPLPCVGEGNGTPLQYSRLGNPMDEGAWWAAVHVVTKSRTRLSDFTFTFPFHALEKEMATYSSVPAWRIPGMGEPGGLPSMGSQRVGHN